MTGTPLDRLGALLLAKVDSKEMTVDQARAELHSAVAEAQAAAVVHAPAPEAVTETGKTPTELAVAALVAGGKSELVAHQEVARRGPGEFTAEIAAESEKIVARQTREQTAAHALTQEGREEKAEELRRSAAQLAQALENGRLLLAAESGLPVESIEALSPDEVLSLSGVLGVKDEFRDGSTDVASNLKAAGLLNTPGQTGGAA